MKVHHQSFNIGEFQCVYEPKSTCFLKLTPDLPTVDDFQAAARVVPGRIKADL